MKYFGEWVLYNPGYMFFPRSNDYWIICISIMIALICVTSILYVISCRQRKQQTQKRLKFTTTKLLLIPLVMLIIYPLLAYFIWDYAFWLYWKFPTIMESYMQNFPMYGLLVYCIIVPVMIVIISVSFVVGRHQRRQEQQQAAQKQKDHPTYTATTD